MKTRIHKYCFFHHRATTAFASFFFHLFFISWPYFFEYETRFGRHRSFERFIEFRKISWCFSSTSARPVSNICNTTLFKYVSKRNSRKLDGRFSEDVKRHRTQTGLIVFWATKRFVRGTLLDTQNGEKVRGKRTGVKNDASKRKLFYRLPRTSKRTTNSNPDCTKTVVTRFDESYGMGLKITL